MSENTKIEWADHIDPQATGRVLGAYKVAAAKTGCSVDDWMRERGAGRRWCFRCRAWKPNAVFSLDGARRGGKSSTCKPCTSEASTASRYGLTVSALRAMREAQGGACGICLTEGDLQVDHDHKSGSVRGLLCANCNSAIGKLKESPSLFAAALAYLEKHRG